MATKKKSSSRSETASQTQKKKNLLKEYLDTTNAEINQKAISSLKPIYKDADILSIDDSILPTLLVLSSDITNGNHTSAIEQAAILKVSLLSVSALQVGETPQPAIPDINSILPMIQGTLGMLPSIINCAGSLIECVGKNMTQGRDDLLFQYGLAMNTGARIGNIDKAHTLQEIGVCIGCIDNNRDKQASCDRFNSLVKTLPNNKYRKRLKELVDLMMQTPEENKIEEWSSSRSEMASPTQKETQQPIEQKADITEPTIKFIVEDDTELVKRTTKQKETTKNSCEDGVCTVKFATDESE